MNNPAPFVGPNALRFKPTTPLAIEVMKESQAKFDEANEHNGTDFARFYLNVCAAVKLEAAAQMVEDAYRLP